MILDTSSEHYKFVETIRELKFITDKINNSDKWFPRLAYTTPELKKEEIMKNLIDREQILRKKLGVYLKNDSTSGVFKSGRDDLSNNIRIVRPIDSPLRLEQEPTEPREPAFAWEIKTFDSGLSGDNQENVNYESGSFAGYHSYVSELNQIKTYIWLFDAAKWYRFNGFDCYLVTHELRYLFPVNKVDATVNYYFRVFGETQLFMGAESGEFRLYALPIEAPDYHSIVDPENFSIDYFFTSQNDENIVCSGNESSNSISGSKYFSGSFEVEAGVQSGMVVIIPITLFATDGYVLAYYGSFHVDPETYGYPSGIFITIEEIL